jgi:hypothetical protein
MSGTSDDREIAARPNCSADLASQAGRLPGSTPQ